MCGLDRCAVLLRDRTRGAPPCAPVRHATGMAHPARTGTSYF